MKDVDTERSPFYAWLDHAAIRDLVHGALALPPGERMVLIKGLIPGLVQESGSDAVDAFLEELRTKARRHAEALAHPGEGAASRVTAGEPLGGPTPEGHAHLGESRDARRAGGRAAEREREAELWNEIGRARKGGERGDDVPASGQA
jgi:hypothetical protein